MIQRLMLLALVFASSLLVSQDAMGVPGPSREMTFVDRDGLLSLTVQMDPAAIDAGRFAFRLGGGGAAYSGRLGDAMKTHSASSVTVHYEGPATFRPLGGLPMRVTVTLQAQIDPDHRKAEATLRHDASRYHLVTGPTAAGGLEATLKTFERAVLGDDPATLLTLMNTTVASRYDRESFAAVWRAQVVEVGRITELRRIAVGQSQRNDLGSHFVIAQYEASVLTPLGSVRRGSFDVHFIEQNREWRLWFTEPR